MLSKHWDSGSNPARQFADTDKSPTYIKPGTLKDMEKKHPKNERDFM